MKVKLILILLFSLFIQTSYSEVNITKDYYTVGGHKMYFYEAGSGSKTILFLHGLLANKEEWVQTMKFMAAKGYYVISPDLPGAGESKDYALEDYTIPRQIVLLHGLIKRMNIDKINLAGSSLGGVLAMKYYEKYRDEVDSIALIGGAFGLGGWSLQIMDDFAEGINPFIPVSLSEFYRQMALFFHSPPAIPQEIASKAVSDNEANLNRLNYIFNYASAYLYCFSANFRLNFDIPFLIIWGSDDRVIPIEQAYSVKNRIAGSKLVIVKDSGHLIMLENPREVSKIYSDFLSKVI